MRLRQVIEQYITLKQSLGFRFRAERRILKAFGKAMGKITMGQVSPVAVRAYLDGQGPVTPYWMRKWGTLRGLYRFALARGMARRYPLPQSAPKVAFQFTPYIYSQPELRRLLQAVTPERTKGLSPQTMRTLLLLLYGAGLRLSEALKLEQDDVDVKERLLQVRQSKFFKSRLVPIGPKLTKVLEDYQTERPVSDGSHRRFLCANKGTPLSCATAERIFRALRLAAEVKRPEGCRYQPRLHDLRHAMATHCLVNGYRQGADVQALLVNLSVYLGHVGLSGTQKYLTITPDLRQQASARFARYALGGSHE
jgi:site-specific recombinase XerD